MKQAYPVINIAWRVLATTNPPLEICRVFKTDFNNLAPARLGDMHILSSDSLHTL